MSKFFTNNYSDRILQLLLEKNRKAQELPKKINTPTHKILTISKRTKINKAQQ